MKPRSLVLVIVVAAAIVASSAFYAQSFLVQSPSGHSEVIDIQIVGGVGQGTTDTYLPDNFKVVQGDNVTLVVLNTDDNTHGLTIPQFHVDTGIIPSGHTATVTFIADKGGTFEFHEPPGYCGAGVGNVCNSAQSMRGNMTVIP